MRPNTRRNFFRGMTAAALGAVGSFNPLSSRLAHAIAPIERRRASHLKLSLAAYSYRQALTARPPKMDLFDFLNLAADLELDGVELTSYYVPPSATAAYFHRLKQRAFLLGLDVSGTSVGNNFCLPDGPARDAQLALVRTWVDNAAELDAPVIRVFAGTVPKGGDEGTAVAQAIAGLKAVLPYAFEKGVTLAIENHGGVTSTPAKLLEIVRAIDAPNFGVNLDTGNFHGDDPYADLAELAPYAVNVQVKTEITRKGKAKEDADLARVVALLREAKYSGYVVLEYEAEEDPTTAVPRHLKTLRRLIG